MQLQLKTISASQKPSFDQRLVKPAAGLPARQSEGGFIGSFWEVLIAVVIVAVLFGSIINGYVATATRCQWSAYSLAAQSLGLQTLEQARCAAWDIATGKNELTNMTLLNRSGDGVSQPMTGYTTNILDVPWKGTNFVVATNYVTIKTIYENNYSVVPVQVQIIRVDVVWPFTGWNNRQLQFYTNSLSTIIAPDNRDPITLGVGG